MKLSLLIKGLAYACLCEQYLVAEDVSEDAADDEHHEHEEQRDEVRHHHAPHLQHGRRYSWGIGFVTWFLVPTPCGLGNMAAVWYWPASQQARGLQLLVTKVSSLDPEIAVGEVNNTCNNTEVGTIKVIKP